MQLANRQRPLLRIIQREARQPNSRGDLSLHRTPMTRVTLANHPPLFLWVSGSPSPTSPAAPRRETKCPPPPKPAEGASPAGKFFFFPQLPKIKKPKKKRKKKKKLVKNYCSCQAKTDSPKNRWGTSLPGEIKGRKKDTREWREFLS